ncbi:hypothetical protein AGMMS49921_03760 [Endomicrobiia bacterium]|nr:hypothetical protein AGMMS49921_03760 [Endomicrobiia bacterium]
MLSLELRETQKKIGYVFQEAALFDFLDIIDNVAFGLRTLTSLDEEEIKQRVVHCLSMVVWKILTFKTIGTFRWNEETCRFGKSYCVSA